MSLERDKLLELLDAIASRLEQGNEDAWLEPDTFERLARMKTFLEEWLQGDFPLTEQEHVATLARLTEALSPEIVVGRGKHTLH